MLNRLERMSRNIRNLIDSGFQVRTVTEEFSQYQDLNKLFLDLHKEYHSKLEDTEQAADDLWFDEIDESIFAFKHFVHNYLQENQDTQSRKSSRSSGSKSKSGSTGSSRSVRMSIKEQSIKEKIKLAELMTEVDYMKQKKLCSEMVISKQTFIPN